MTAKRYATLTIVVFLVLLMCGLDAFAGQRTRSGSYQGRKASGSFQQQVNRSPGHVERTTTWQNQRGQGSRTQQRSWDRNSGTGNYSSSTTRTDGRTYSREGTVTRTGDNTYQVEGTRTGPNGRSAEVEKTLTRNEDGTRSVHSVVTGPEGQSRTTDRTIQKTEDGRSVTGTYATSAGKSGTFESTVVHGEDGTVKTQSLTNQDGRTWNRRVHRQRQGNTINRDVTVENPDGLTRTHSESVTFDTGGPSPN
jgi:hypothetical protein